MKKFEFSIYVVMAVVFATYCANEFAGGDYGWAAFYALAMLHAVREAMESKISRLQSASDGIGGA